MDTVIIFLDILGGILGIGKCTLACSEILNGGGIHRYNVSIVYEKSSSMKSNHSDRYFLMQNREVIRLKQQLAYIDGASVSYVVHQVYGKVR